MLAVLVQRKLGQASRRLMNMATHIGRAEIVLERNEFDFSICSETVNPFPELGLISNEIIEERVSETSETLVRKPLKGFR